MTANPADDPVRSRDLARLDELTGPHLPYPLAPIGPALAHMTPGDRAEVIAILGRIGDPRETSPDPEAVPERSAPHARLPAGRASAGPIRGTAA